MPAMSKARSISARRASATNGQFSMTVDAPSVSVPTGFTATVTSNDGATSEFSRPIGMSD